jgi:hypothetical protein
MRKKLSDMEIQEIIFKTKTGYSYERYGAFGWINSIRNLWDLGYTKKQIEWIMLSKITRWAADSFMVGEYGSADGTEVVQYHNKYGNKNVLREYA